MAYQDVLVRVGADVSNLTSGLTRGQQTLRGFGRAATMVGSTVATTFGSMAAASAGGIGYMVSQASSFESAFAGVRKTVDATESEFRNLSKGILDMSREIPASADEIAHVAEVAGQLGVKQDDILKFTRTMIDMGVSTQLSAEDAATSLARFANITGMSMDDIDRLGSVVVALGNNLATTEPEIVNMGLRLAGAGNQIGLTEDQIMSFAAALSSVGVRVEAGGTAFSRVFLNMNTAVKNGGEELENFAKVAGMSASDFRTSFEDDAATAVVAFIEGLGDIQESGGNVAEVLDDLGLGEIRVRDALMRAAGAGDLFSDSIKLGSKAWKENTALAEEAQERYDTFASKLKIFANRINYIAKIFGAPLMNALSGFLDALDPVLDMLEKLAEKFYNADESTQQMVGAMISAVPIITGLAAAIFGVLAVVGSLILGLQTLASALGVGVGAAVLFTAKVALIGGAIMAAIAAVTALAIAVVFKWDEIKKATSDLIKTVKNKFDNFKDIMSDSSLTTREKLDEITNGFSEKMIEIAQTVGEKSKEIADKLLDMLPPSVADFIRDTASNIADVFREMGETIKDILNGDFSAIGELFAELGPTIAGIIVGGIPGIIIAASNYIPAITDTIVENIDRIFEVATQIVQRFNEGMQEKFPEIIEKGVELIQKLSEGIAEALPIIIEAVTEILITFVEAISEKLPEIVDSGMEIIEKLVEGITEALPTLLETFSKILLLLVAAVAELVPEFVGMGVEILTALIDGIVQLLPELINTGVELINNLATAILEMLPTIIDAGVEILLALIDGIIQVLPSLVDAAVKLITAVADTVLDNLPRILDAGVEILLALIDGIIKMLPQLVDAGIKLIVKLAEVIIQNLPKILAAGVKVLGALVKGIMQSSGDLLNAGYELLSQLLAKIAEFIPDMMDKGVELIGSLIDGALSLLGEIGSAGAELVGNLMSKIGSFISNMVSLGKNLIGGLIDGIGSMKDAAVAKAQDIGRAVKNKISSYFSIHSPSRVMRDEIGKNIGRGLIVGMDEEVRHIQRMAQKVSEAAMPEQPKLAGFEVGDIRGYSQEVTSRIRAEATGFNFDRDSEENLLGEIRDELREQREMIIQLDGRTVGKAVEPYVSRNKKRSDYTETKGWRGRRA